MDAIEAIHGRRSIRDYEDRAVERELIEAILWDAAQAPSTPVSGDTPWRFNVIEGRERIAGFGERAKAHARAHRPAPDAPGYGWADRAEFIVFLGAPAVVIISGAAENSQAPAECVRAGQNLMISAHARGLGSCWVGAPMLWLADPDVRAELGMPDGWTPHAVFALGHPRSIPPGKPRGKPQIIWSN